MIKIIRNIAILMFTLSMTIIVAGQTGLFNGKRPTDPGRRNGKLKTTGSVIQ